MDPFTQGAIGAALPQSFAPAEKVRSAALIGALGGMAPDLDVFIRSSTDPLLFLDYHRQFTHALLFVPIGALVCCLAFYPFVRNLTFKQTYFFCFLGYLTHGLLDACTSYGTMLFWPLSEARVAWNNISVIDPLATIPLIFCVLLAARKRRPLFAQLGIIWMLSYLAIGFLQKERAEILGKQLASDRGHSLINIEAKPSFGNLILWKIIYESENQYFVDAVRLGTKTHLIPGESLEKLRLKKHFPNLDRESQQAKDIDRFREFSRGYLALDPNHPTRIMDARYSMIPNEIEPIWSIELVRPPTPNPSQHVDFITNRSNSQQKLRQLITMLKGD